jgi:predicted permease
VAAGLFTKSLMNVSRVDLGINVDHLVTFAIAPQLNGYTPERSRQLFERLESDLGAQPGVTRVAGSMVGAIAGDNWGSSLSVEGFPAGPDTDTHAFYNEVGPGYFDTMGIRLLAGREFTPADRLGSPKVAIVNEAFARKFNLGTNVLGKRLSTAGNAQQLDTQIVGLVRDAKYSEVREPAPPQFFRPYKQNDSLGWLIFYLRTSTDPDQFLQTINRVVAQADANLPIDDLRTMPQVVRENVFLDRMISTLSAGFAILATILAAVGLYGVLAYTIAQRTREIGLRMALGAAPAQVRRMVLARVAIMTAIGGAVGLLGASWIGRAAQSLLFEMKGSDPAVLAFSAVLLTLVALGAGFIPAHRASRIDPMRALRYE